MDRHDGCKCHPESPFLWAQQRRPSFAVDERNMRAIGDSGLSKSHISTLNTERQKASGKNNSTIHGISRDKEAELLRVKNFHQYSKAGKDKVDFEITVQDDGNVAA